MFKRDKHDRRGVWLKTLAEQISSGIDEQGLKSLRALSSKISRDYLQFFQGISARYQRGKIKDTADDAIDTAKQILVILSGIETSRTVSKEDTKTIPELIEVLSQYIEFFSEEQSKNKRFQNLLEEISRETGVNLSNLGVTPAIGSQVLKEAKRAFRKDRPSITGGLRESKWGLGRGLQTAVLGPFSPFLDVSKTLLGDVGDIGGRLWRRFQHRGSSQLLRDLSSSGQVSQGRSESGGGEKVAPSDDRVSLKGFFEDGAYKSRWTKDLLAQVTKIAEKPDCESSLSSFYDKEALKTRWTKDLLGYTKKISEKSEGRSSDGGSWNLLQKFKDLGLVISPFIGKTGLFVALATATVAVTIATKNAVEGYISALRRLGESTDRLERAASDKLQELKKIGLEEYAQRAGKTETGVLIDLDALRTKSQFQRYTERPWWSKEKFLGRLGGTYLGRNPYAPKIEPFKQRLQELEAQIPKVDTQSAAPVPPVMNITVPGLDKVGDAIKESVAGIRQAAQSPQQQTPGLINIHDSGDTLIQEYAKGSLSQGD